MGPDVSAIRGPARAGAGSSGWQTPLLSGSGSVHSAGAIECRRGISVAGIPSISGNSALSLGREKDSGVLDLDRARGSETVLLVEDDDAVRAVTRRALVRFGYSVLPATGGTEALEIARGHPKVIELLLTDIMMPGMNGVEVATEVGRIRPGIRIFYMSGYADQDLVREGLLSPGTRFLQKPFTPQELAERVREILDDA